MKEALIAGQDGSFLAELLIEKGYELQRIVRRSASLNTARLDHLHTDPHEGHPKLRLHYGNVGDSTSLVTILRAIESDELYHLGAQSDVAGVVRDAGVHGRRDGHRHDPPPRRDPHGGCQDPLLPGIVVGDVRLRTAAAERVDAVPPAQPLHVRQVFAYHATVNYREAYGMHASNGILFKHECERRGETFVTRQITRAVAAIAAGKQDYVDLGNLAQARLGFRRGLRPGHVAPAPAGTARRLRDRHRRGPYRA